MLGVQDGTVTFTPLDKGVRSASGQTVGFDAFVELDGTPLQHGSRANLRPFNGSELRKILRLGSCVDCHDSYGDPIWKNYNDQTVCTRAGADDYFVDAIWPRDTAQVRHGEKEE